MNIIQEFAVRKKTNLYLTREVDDTTAIEFRKLKGRYYRKKGQWVFPLMEWYVSTPLSSCPPSPPPPSPSSNPPSSPPSNPPFNPLPSSPPSNPLPSSPFLVNKPISVRDVYEYYPPSVYFQIVRPYQILFEKMI